MAAHGVDHPEITTLFWDFCSQHRLFLDCFERGPWTLHPWPSRALGRRMADVAKREDVRRVCFIISMGEERWRFRSRQHNL